jgi:acetamidase/formamidase
LAQTKVITGTVASSVEGEGGIPGVTIQVKGTTIGTTTDINGKYTLTVPQKATTLVFSYIGMKKQEVEIGGRSTIDAIMESDLLGLDEVIVTALGISREKKSLGYSVQVTISVKQGNRTLLIHFPVRSRVSRLHNPIQWADQLMS